MNKNCQEIKNLEERLACLQEKYQKLTEELELERHNMVSDEIGNYDSLITDRTFVQKQIDITKKRLEAKSRIDTNKNTSTVNLGTCVKLINGNVKLEVCLVSEQEAYPSKGHVSTNSPIGKAILGRSKGEEIRVNLPSGVTAYTISKIY